jgi:hypothetical protein
MLEVFNVDSSVVNQVLRRLGYGRPLGGALVMHILKVAGAGLGSSD